MEFNLPSDNNRQLSNLCGALDQNLKQIEAALEVDIVRRGSNFIVNGSAKNVKAAAALIQKFYKAAGAPIELEDVQLGLVEINKFEKGIKAVDAVEHPVGFCRQADQFVVRVQVELIPEFDGHVLLGLACRAGAAIIDAHATDQVRLPHERTAIQVGIESR